MSHFLFNGVSSLDLGLIVTEPVLRPSWEEDIPRSRRRAAPRLLGAAFRLCHRALLVALRGGKFLRAHGRAKAAPRVAFGRRRRLRPRRRGRPRARVGRHRSLACPHGATQHRGAPLAAPCRPCRDRAAVRSGIARKNIAAVNES